MAVVDNFYFSIFLRLMWEFLDLESEREVSIYWPNNKIIDPQHIQILEQIVGRVERDGFRTYLTSLGTRSWTGGAAGCRRGQRSRLRRRQPGG